jgi:lysophospholipase L1-like esterase
LRFTLLLLVLLAGATPVLAQQCGPAASYASTRAIPRPDAWIDRQRNVQTVLSARSFDAIAVGDSIMQGWPRGMLETALGLPTLNAGFGADGTSQTLWRLDTFDWSRQHPRYVLILVGTNNLGVAACAVIDGVLAVVEKVHQVFPQAAIIVTSILPRGDNLMVRDDEIAEINRQLDLAAAKSGFQFFNVHDAFICGHRTPCALYKPGNLHLTAEGYELLSNNLRRFVAG